MISNLAASVQRDFDARYEQLLTGKQVAIVGPAETLIGSGQGAFIDSCDLVVRFNTVIEYLPFPADLARDIGSKTDILYANNEVLVDGIVGQQKISHARFAALCEELAVQYIIGTNNDFTYAEAPPGRKCYADFEAFKGFLEAQENRPRFRMLFATSDLARQWMNGYVGRTGFLAILDLLAYDIERLYITGMTFYHKGGHLFLTDQAAELHPLKNHLGILPPDNMLGHNSYLELELMRALAGHFGDKLTTDQRLQNLLDGHSDQ